MTEQATRAVAACSSVADVSERSDSASRVGGMLLAIILCLHVTLGVAYSLVTPIGEGHDEWGHFAYVRYVATERKIPSSGERLLPELTYNMTHHPPLYYVMGALSCFWIDMSDGLRPSLNAHFQDSGHGPNVYLHSSREEWPYRGSVLAFHVVRLLSVFMSAISVLATYLIAREILVRQRFVAVAAAGLVAFTPQMLYMGSIVNNDIAVTMWVTLLILSMVRLVKRGWSLGRLAAMIALMSAATLTKANSLALLPVVLLALMLSVRGVDRSRRRRVAAQAGLSLLLLLVVILAWDRWNTHLQGHFASITGTLETVIKPSLTGEPTSWGTGLHWDVIPRALRYAFVTFWGVFGWGHIAMDAWIYDALAALCAVAIVGDTWGLWRWRRRLRAGSAWMLPLISVTCVVVLPIYLVLVSGTVIMFPGRYALPSISGVGLAIAAGLAAVAPSRLRNATLLVVVLAMLTLSTVVPVRVIQAAYARPTLLADGALSNLSDRTAFVFGDQVKLVAYRVEDEALAPGEMVTVDLFWRFGNQMNAGHSVAVQLLDANQVFYGGTSRFLGHGGYGPMTALTNGIFKETYHFRLGEDYPDQTYARLKVALYLDQPDHTLAVTDVRGNAVGEAAVFGRLRVATQKRREDPEVASRVEFGETIRLTGYTLGVLMPGSPTELRLHWACLNTTDQDYTVFVHLVDSSGATIAQADRQPRNGTYPTSLWQRGERIVDPHRIEVPNGLPPGEYTLRVGLYLLGTLERLAITNDPDTGGVYMAAPVTIVAEAGS